MESAVRDSAARPVRGLRGKPFDYPHYGFPRQRFSRLPNGPPSLNFWLRGEQQKCVRDPGAVGPASSSG